MQIELNGSTEQILGAQAAAHGCSIDDHVAGVLSRYAAASVQPLALSGQFTIRTHEDALAWILSRNPDFMANAPENTDWQAWRSEGRP